MYRSSLQMDTQAKVDAYRDAVREQFAGAPFKIQSNGRGLRVECLNCRHAAVLNPERFIREHACTPEVVEVPEVTEVETDEAQVEAPQTAEVPTIEYTAADVAQLVQAAKEATSVKDDRDIAEALRWARCEEVPWFDFVAQGARDSHNDSDDYEVVQSLIFHGSL